MRHHPIRWAILLLWALVCAACGPAASRSTMPPTMTPIPPTPTLPTVPGATITAAIKSVGGGQIESYLYGIAADDGAVWVHNAERGTVARVDPKTNKVVATIRVGQGLGDVVLGAGAVWVATRDDRKVSRIDPATNRVVGNIKLPSSAGFLAASPGAIWVASKESNTVWKIDPQTNQIVAELVVPAGPAWMSFGAGSLWICIHDGEKAGVTRLDPMNNQVLAQIDIGDATDYYCGGLAASDAGIWVELLDLAQDHILGLARIDPASNRVVARIPLRPSVQSMALAVDAQRVWIADPEIGLFRITSQTNQAVGLLPRLYGAGLALGAGSVWLIVADGTLLRITPTS